MSNYIKGTDLIVTVDGTAIAAAKSCDIDISSETIEVSSPSQGTYKHYIAGRKTWTVTTNHLVLAVGNNAAMVGTTVTLVFGVEGSDTITGTAVVTKWKCTGTRGNLAQGSFQFQGTGAIG